jgi:hypothetical protein
MSKKSFIRLFASASRTIASVFSAIEVSGRYARMELIRFGGHLPYEAYDVQTDGRPPHATTTTYLHG